LDLIIFLAFSNLALGCPISCHFYAEFRSSTFRSVGRDSSVGTATRYGRVGNINQLYEAETFLRS